MVEQRMDELRRAKGGGWEHPNHGGENTRMSEWDDGGALSGVYVSSDGKVYSVDELLEAVLEKDEKRKRRFSK